jgi:hypothetical protein
LWLYAEKTLHLHALEERCGWSCPRAHRSGGAIVAAIASLTLLHLMRSAMREPASVIRKPGGRPSTTRVPMLHERRTSNADGVRKTGTRELSRMER